MNSTRIIKSFRAKQLLSQKKVAELMGITRQSYNTLENDLLHYDFTLIFKLLNILKASEIEVNEFFYALKQDYLSCKDNLKN